MIIKRKVGPKGQVVIPKDVRELLNIKPGSEVLIEIRNDEIVIRSNLSGQEFLKKFTETPKKLSKKIDFKQINDKQYERA
jgi:AbrB family looped-hinge helix DNA binding protein